MLDIKNFPPVCFYNFPQHRSFDKIYCPIITLRENEFHMGTTTTTVYKYNNFERKNFWYNNYLCFRTCLSFSSKYLLLLSIYISVFVCCLPLKISPYLFFFSAHVVSVFVVVFFFFSPKVSPYYMFYLVKHLDDLEPL